MSTKKQAEAAPSKKATSSAADTAPSTDATSGAEATPSTAPSAPPASADLAAKEAAPSPANTSPSALAQSELTNYLIGWPIAHSKSPEVYNEMYEKLGLKWHYELAPFESAEEASAFIACKNFAVLNITTPYKALALSCATAAASSAKLASGANLLVCKENALIAYNTDGTGCMQALKNAGQTIEGKRVLVCGTGSVGLSIIHAAALEGAGEVTLLSRNKNRAHKALSNYLSTFKLLAFATIDLPISSQSTRTFRESYENTHFKFGSYKTSTQAIESADIIINATPLGMKENDKLPFTDELIGAHHYILDAVYGHGDAPFMKAAHKQGASAQNGEGMLLAQAVQNMQIICDINHIPYTQI